MKNEIRTNWTKKQAVQFFGNRVNMAKALGTTVQGVYILPNKLPRKKQDEITGLTVRLGLQPVDAA